MTRLGVLSASATLAAAMLGCRAPATEPAGGATILVPPAVVAPPPSGSASRPPAKPPDGFQEQVFAALEGICERAWWMKDGDLRVGCKQCPRLPWVSREDAMVPPTAAIAQADPALHVLRRFAARLMGNAVPEIVLSYDGCRPESDNVGTLVIDAEKKCCSATIRASSSWRARPRPATSARSSSASVVDASDAKSAFTIRSIPKGSIPATPPLSRHGTRGGCLNLTPSPTARSGM